MNRPRKEKGALSTFVPATAHRWWCVLFLLCLFLPAGFAGEAVNDIGLLNPAEKDFGEFRPAVRNTENFIRKTPAFGDRMLPASSQSSPRQTEGIRQVSALDEREFDPFPAAAQPMLQPTAPQVNPFDGNAAASAVPNYPAQHHFHPNNLVPNYHPNPYDPHALAAMPHAAVQGMQNMQHMYPMGMEQDYQTQLAMQQFAQLQFAQQHFPQQGFMMDGMNPYADPYANMYAWQNQYAQIAPHNMPHNMMGNPAMQEQQLYQMLLQELARQQAEARGSEGDEEDIDESRRQADANWTLNNLVPVRVSSPLGETLLVCAKTVSPFNTPSGPDKGVGMPLVGKSWLDHPYYFGGFVGCISGSELVSGMIDQKNGASGGFTFGYNFSDYWGLESRLHFAAIDIRDTAYAQQLFEEAWNDELGVMPPFTTRTNELTILDAAIHYYPLGNAKWRPYFKYGLGVGRQNYVNTFGFENTSNIVTMPMGVGMRYWWNERIAIQMDLHNNIVFASGNTKTQHNIAFTMGLTYAFGNSRRTAPVHYWPATPSMGSKW